MDEKQLKILLDLYKKVETQARQLGTTNPFTEDQIKNANEFNSTLASLTSQFNSFRDALDAINNDLGGIVTSITRTIEELGRPNEGINRVFRSLRSIRDVGQKILLEQEGELEFNTKELEGIERRFKEAFSVISEEAKKGGLDALIEKQEELLNNITNKQTKEYEKQAKKLEELKDLQSFITDETGKQIELENKLINTIQKAIDKRKSELKEVKELGGLLTSIPASLESFLQKQGLGDLAEDLGLDELIDFQRDIAEKQIKKIRAEGREITLEDRSEVIGQSLMKALELAKNALKDPFKLLATLIKPLFRLLKKAFIEVDESAGNISKQFNLTYQESVALRGEMVTIANASNELFVNSKALQETLAIINKDLGTANFRDLPEGFEQSLIFLTQLTKQAGLLDEEMLGISKLVLTTGEDAKVITGEVLAQAELSSLRQGVLINEKEVLRDIKDISAATTLSLQKNPEALGEAVSTAKALGLELSKVEAISESLLNFQSSIESELEAELLIGRNLTLERARFAALNNDVATVTEEIAKNLGSAAEFGRLNRIQQQALAGAVGMSREELGEMLFTQEQLLGLTEKEATRRQQVINKLIQENGLEGAKAILQQQSIERLEQQTAITEDFRALVLKLQEAFVRLATVLSPILKILNGALVLVSKLVGLLDQVTTYVGKTIPTLLGDTEENAQKSGRMLSAMAMGGLAGSVLGPAGAALGAGIAGLGAGIAENVFNADDLYSEGDGYGERTLLTPEGTFRLNDEDNFIAGTDDSLRSIATRSMRPREISTGTTMNVINSREFAPISNINTSPVSNIQSNYSSTTTQASNEEVVAQLKTLNEKIDQNTRENKQNAMLIARTKSTLEYVPTRLGTDLMKNSTDIQYG